MLRGSAPGGLIPPALSRATNLLGGRAPGRDEGRSGAFPRNQAIEGFGEAINRLFHLLDLSQP
jgi:hypothetical protein